MCLTSFQLMVRHSSENWWGEGGQDIPSAARHCALGYMYENQKNSEIEKIRTWSSKSRGRRECEKNRNPNKLFKFRLLNEFLFPILGRAGSLDK